MKAYLRMLMFFLVFLGTMAGSISFSNTPELGNEGGAGGHGMVIENKLYLVDLIEAGVERSVHVVPVDESNAQFQKVSNAISERMSFLGDSYNTETNKILVSKLIELHRYNSVLALMLVDGINRLNWSLVSKELINVWLEKPVVKGGPYVQLAVRRDRHVRINRDHFKSLDEGNRAALIVHEVLYAMEKLVPLYTYESKVYYKLGTGQISRELTGIIFSRKITVRDILKDASLKFGRYSSWSVVGEVNDEGVTFFKYQIFVSEKYIYNLNNAYNGTPWWSDNAVDVTRENDAQIAKNLCAMFKNDGREAKIGVKINFERQFNSQYYTWQDNRTVIQQKIYLSNALTDSSFHYTNLVEELPLNSKEDCMPLAIEMVGKAKKILMETPSIFN